MDLAENFRIIRYLSETLKSGVFLLNSDFEDPHPLVGIWGIEKSLKILIAVIE